MDKISFEWKSMHYNNDVVLTSFPHPSWARGRFPLLPWLRGVDEPDVEDWGEDEGEAGDGGGADQVEEGAEAGEGDGREDSGSA